MQPLLRERAMKLELQPPLTGNISRMAYADVIIRAPIEELSLRPWRPDPLVRSAFPPRPV